MASSPAESFQQAFNQAFAQQGAIFEPYIKLKMYQLSKKMEAEQQEEKLKMLNAIQRDLEDYKHKNRMIEEDLRMRNERELAIQKAMLDAMKGKTEDDRRWALEMSKMIGRIVEKTGDPELLSSYLELIGRGMPPIQQAYPTPSQAYPTPSQAYPTPQTSQSPQTTQSPLQSPQTTQEPPQTPQIGEEPGYVDPLSAFNLHLKSFAERQKEKASRDFESAVLSYRQRARLFGIPEDEQQRHIEIATLYKGDKDKAEKVLNSFISDYSRMAQAKISQGTPKDVFEKEEAKSFSKRLDGLQSTFQNVETMISGNEGILSDVLRMPDREISSASAVSNIKGFNAVYNVAKGIGIDIGSIVKGGDALGMVNAINLVISRLVPPMSALMRPFSNADLEYTMNLGGDPVKNPKLVKLHISRFLGYTSALAYANREIEKIRADETMTLSQKRNRFKEIGEEMQAFTIVSMINRPPQREDGSVDKGTIGKYMNYILGSGSLSERTTDLILRSMSRMAPKGEDWREYMSDTYGIDKRLLGVGK